MNPFNHVNHVFILHFLIGRTQGADTQVRPYIFPQNPRYRHTNENHPLKDYHANVTRLRPGRVY